LVFSVRWAIGLPPKNVKAHKAQGLYSWVLGGEKSEIQCILHAGFLCVLRRNALALFNVLVFGEIAYSLNCRYVKAPSYHPRAHGPQRFFILSSPPPPLAQRPPPPFIGDILLDFVGLGGWVFFCCSFLIACEFSPQTFG
jgi:hypothetical protein